MADAGRPWLLGRSEPRVDGLGKVTGEARFVALAPIALAIGALLDEALEGMRAEPVLGLRRHTHVVAELHRASERLRKRVRKRERAAPRRQVHGVAHGALCDRAGGADPDARERPGVDAGRSGRVAQRYCVAAYVPVKVSPLGGQLYRACDVGCR